MRGKLLLIFNPKAGQALFAPNLYEVIERFTRNGFLVTAYPTQANRDATEITLACGGEYDCLVCSGGDGTLNEVVDGLMRLPRRPVFGYIPSGTTNDFAHSLGLPDDVLLAADVICGGIPREIDIGRFQDGHFSYIAAFGLFTDVSYGTSQSMKNALGHAAYMLEGVKRLANIRSWHCRVDCDGERFEGDFIFGMITNSASVGGFKLPIGPEGREGDGRFEMILLKRVRRFSHLQDVISVIMGNSKSSDAFIVRSAKRIAISCDEALEWTLDGEYGGSFNDVEIQVEQGALSIMTPPQAGEGDGIEGEA